MTYKFFALRQVLAFETELKLGGMATLFDSAIKKLWALCIEFSISVK